MHTIIFTLISLLAAVAVFKLIWRSQEDCSP